MFEAVNNEEIKYGSIPLENSLTGSIHENYDLLFSYNVWIVGEIRVKIVHNLVAHQSTEIKNLREIRGHPEVLRQCSKFLGKNPEIKIVSICDSCSGCRLLKEKGEQGVGVKNTPGILFKCLSVFALRNIDLLKLESRPIIGKSWQYFFYVDRQGSIEDNDLNTALKTLEDVVAYYKFMGSYKEGETIEE